MFTLYYYFHERQLWAEYSLVMQTCSIKYIVSNVNF